MKHMHHHPKDQEMFHLVHHQNQSNFPLRRLYYNQSCLRMLLGLLDKLLHQLLFHECRLKCSWDTLLLVSNLQSF